MYTVDCKLLSNRKGVTLEYSSFRDILLKQIKTYFNYNSSFNEDGNIEIKESIENIPNVLTEIRYWLNSLLEAQSIYNERNIPEVVSLTYLSEKDPMVNIWIDIEYEKNLTERVKRMGV